MKAYLIDVINEEVRTVALTDDDSKRLKEMYKLIGCHTFTVATVLENDDTIFVDDEGLLTLNARSKFFTFEGAHQPFVGNGLIMGYDDEGESLDVKSKLTDIKKRVKFHTLNEVREMLG